MARVLCATIIASALLLSACATFEAATPSGFVELEQDDTQYDYRAITADGLVIATRAIDHEPEGELDFWVRAIENRLRQRGGYALLETRDVTCRSGQQGKQLRFGHDEGHHPHLYYLSVFVTEDTIFLLEAGGSQELMERHAEQIDWAVANFVIK